MIKTNPTNCAHPGYYKIGPWHDWVLVMYENVKDLIIVVVAISRRPSHIFTIF